MKMKLIFCTILFFVLIFPLALKAQTTVTDIDGNVYHTVTIGTQVWMVENLKATKYNDGTAIPLVEDGTTWGALTTPGYCWYNNDEAANKAEYGALYNKYAVNTGKLCPASWHVPTDAEWKILEIYLGMSQAQADNVSWRGTDQGTQLRNTSGWISGGNGTNTSGFSALPGGYRYAGGLGVGFENIGNIGFWWSSTTNTENWWRSMRSNVSWVSRGSESGLYGFSVRCLKN